MSAVISFCLEESNVQPKAKLTSHHL